MRLRTEDHPSPRLTPQEARAFLEVHAEREAAGSAGDAPTLGDLAETLHLSPEEARTILDEARTRAAVPVPAPRPRTSSVPVILAGAAAVAVAMVFRGMASVRMPQSPVMTLATVDLSPIAPIEYFGVQIGVAGGSAQRFAPANPKTFGKPLPRLSASEAIDLRALLTLEIVNMVDAADESDERWRTSERLSIGIDTPDAHQTDIELPLPSGMLPLGHDPLRRERLRAALAPLLDAAWPQISVAPR